MNNSVEPISWVANPRARSISFSSSVESVFPADTFAQTQRFHRQIPGYRPSPLKSLANLASMLGVGGIWVKDESQRLDLNSFKVLGGSFAIYEFIKNKLGLEDEDLTFEDLVSEATRVKLGDITFATATDGNHGRGVAWGAAKLNCKAVIYVHKDTSLPRIRAIESYGAEVRVIDGNYDVAVHQASVDAEANGWQVISDTSWPGYTDIPKWVMQGYTTLLSETQEQLAGTGIIKPTHVFVQAGVGSCASIKRALPTR